MQVCHLAKSGWVWKRAKVTRQWLKRWATVRKGVLRYCDGPGMVIFLSFAMTTVCQVYSFVNMVNLHAKSTHIATLVTAVMGTVVGKLMEHLCKLTVSHSNRHQACLLTPLTPCMHCCF